MACNVAIQEVIEEHHNRLISIAYMYVIVLISNSQLRELLATCSEDEELLEVQ